MEHPLRDLPMLQSQVSQSSTFGREFLSATKYQIRLHSMTNLAHDNKIVIHGGVGDENSFFAGKMEKKKKLRG